MIMSFARLGALAAASLIALTGTVGAQQLEKINFAFQWVAGGDHAPYYYAKKTGMYEKAGLDVNFEHLRGSAAAAQRSAQARRSSDWRTWASSWWRRGREPNSSA
jgi:ABC-type nitrate/sulfonate/bicarbonate transport system substrate-binding protein